MNLEAILLVDDDEIANFLHTRLLKREDVANELLVAKHGREALSILDSRQAQNLPYPELILLDIKMPVMDGIHFLEVYAAIRETLVRQPRIIMLTSSMNQRDIEEAMAAGADAFLDKPLTSEKIQALREQYF